MNINIINLALAIGTVLMQLLIIKLIIIAIFREQLGKSKCVEWLKKYAMKIAFTVALLATLGSLFYSLVLGWIPCELCWYQRILLYPQVLLLGIAVWGKSLNGRLYAMWLSGIGGLIAVYQVLLQFGVTEATSCNLSDVSCATINMLQFNYITFPVMSLTVFVLIFLLAYNSGK